LKGFVIALRRASNEDMIAVILSRESIRSYYRFYGARHSILQLGHLVDFEVEGDGRGFMPRLRSLSQTNFRWLRDQNRLLLWHNFIKLFEPHLRDTEDLDSFYYDLLLQAAMRWERQNPQRIIIESYASILQQEGRLHPIQECYICEGRLDKSVALMSSFRPAHPECIYSLALELEPTKDFLESGRSIVLDDESVEQICSVVLKGL